MTQTARMNIVKGLGSQQLLKYYHFLQLKRERNGGRKTPHPGYHVLDII